MARLAEAATATGLQQANGHGAAPRSVGPALRTAPRPAPGCWVSCPTSAGPSARPTGHSTTWPSKVKAFEAANAARQVREPVAVERSDEPDAPVVEVANAIVAQALRDPASDIHIEPQGDRTRVRYRVDGALHEVLSLPPAMGPVLASRIKIIANVNIGERRAQGGQFASVIDGRPSTCGWPPARRSRARRSC
jgi:hypothetical protein